MNIDRILRIVCAKRVSLTCESIPPAGSTLRVHRIADRMDAGHV
jgi:hypothetical protein